MGKRKYRSTQALTFNISATDGKNIFLEYAMKVLGDKSVHIESRSNKFTFHVEGDRNEVAGKVEILSSFAIHINNAFTMRRGNYRYHKNLLKQLFERDLRLHYFKQAMSIYGYKCEIDGDSIVTRVGMDIISEIYIKASDAQLLMHSKQNRDIRRFFALLHLHSGLVEEEIVSQALSNDIIKIVDNKFHFAMDHELALEKMFDILETPTIHDTIKMSEDEEFVMNDFFEGGKIVFMKNGEELDSSPFDYEVNNKDKEV